MKLTNKKLRGWQWLILRRERVAQIAVGILLVACGYALFNGFTEANSQQRDVQASLNYQAALFDKTRESLAEFERKPPAESSFSIPNAATTVRNDLANFKAVLPPAPVAPLAAGQSDIYPQAFYYRKFNDDSPSQATVEGRSLSNVFPAKLTANPLRLLTGRFDLSFVLVYIFPLIIIALTFNLVASEKETGTLALTLSQPITLEMLTLNKIYIRFILVGSAAILIPALCVAIYSFLNAGAASLWRLVIWILAAAGYGLFWFALAAIINLHGKSSARNALTLAVFWLAVVILIPVLAGLAAQKIFQIPSSIVIADRERAIRTEVQDRTAKSLDLIGANFRIRFPLLPDEKAGSPRLNNLRNTENLGVPEADELLASYYKKYPAYAANTKYGQLVYAAQQAREENIEGELFLLLEAVEKGRRRQETFVQICGLISPSILLQKVIGDVAGTGASRHENFVRQFDEYVRQRNKYFSDKIFKGENINSADIQEIAKFTYREESVSDVISRISLPLFILIIVPILLLLWTIRAYRKTAVAQA